MFDEVNKPAHYASHPSGVECVVVAEHLGFNLGNAFKYVFRHNNKNNPKTDLAKAIWYLKRESKLRAKTMYQKPLLDSRVEKEMNKIFDEELDRKVAGTLMSIYLAAKTNSPMMFENYLNAALGWVELLSERHA